MEKDGQREGRSTVRPLRKGIQTSWKEKWEKRQCQLDGLKGIVYMKRKQGEDWVWKSVDLKVSVQVNLWSVVGGRGGSSVSFPPCHIWLSSFFVLESVATPGSSMASVLYYFFTPSIYCVILLASCPFLYHVSQSRALCLPPASVHLTDTS